MFSRLRRVRPSRDQRGFTMIEVIVMASVMTIGILSTLMVANATLQTSDANEHRVAATNLAREGVELVRAARDSNWQAYSREFDTNDPPDEESRQKWDCYATTPAQSQADPPECDPAVRFTANTGPVNYVVYPNVGNGVPYFVRNDGGNPSQTKQNTYRICQGIGSEPPVYRPAPTGDCTPATNRGGPFYRRVTVQRGKDLGGGQYNLLVRSYVTWIENENDPLVVEEYLTDWRKFR